MSPTSQPDRSTALSTSTAERQGENLRAGSAPQSPVDSVLPANAECIGSSNREIKTDAMVQAFSILAGKFPWPLTTLPGYAFKYCWEGTEIYLTNTAQTEYTVTGDDWWACRDERRKCSDRMGNKVLQFLWESDILERRNSLMSVAVSRIGCFTSPLFLFNVPLWIDPFIHRIEKFVP